MAVSIHCWVLYSETSVSPLKGPSDSVGVDIRQV